MEEIYINVEYPKPISQTPAEHQGKRDVESNLYPFEAELIAFTFICIGSTSSKKMHHVGVLMGLLNVLLLIGLIVLGVRLFTGSCYLLSTKSGSWDEGREDCRNQGADLAVIENDDEQAFLSTVNKNDAWIGLTDKETEGLWQWVDGSPLHLQYWLENQPDNGGSRLQRWGEEDCAHTSNPKAFWNDLSCSASKMWICEKLVA
uniref:C-type lectin domain-containing protein n=1 Tax=Nothobranchius furzeri TaxID=105023 RepID=A0A8C6LYC0_NOTFU